MGLVLPSAFCLGLTEESGSLKTSYSNTLRSLMPPKRAAGTVAPMDELYFRLFREHSATKCQVAILLQVGKFYEMYDSITEKTGACITNVRAVAEACACAV